MSRSTGPAAVAGSAGRSGGANGGGAAPARGRPPLWARMNRGSWVERLAGYAFFIGLWQLFATVLVGREFILPPPSGVVEKMVEILASGQLWPNMAVTFTVLLRAFAVGLVIGVAVGVAMGLSRWWDGFFRDGLLLVFSTPGLVVVLICLIIFGLSWVGPLVAIALITVPYVALNVWEGVRAVPRETMDMARAFRMGYVTRVRHVVIPSVAPYLFQGMRFGFAISWKIAMLTEVFGGNDGIGYNIRVSSIQFEMDALLAWVFWFVAVALVLERVVLQRLVDHSLRWRPEVAE